ncbi:MAG TPA: beta-L-arabinofuranosidase domain-containing protein [Vicinamibacterales bacterium]|nr:beta-L-arabinofuranosidase domain-containing protein [Vicinamibacterales bacterium]
MPDPHGITRRGLLQSLMFLPALPRPAWAARSSVGSPAGIRPLAFTDVDVHDEFWAPRMEVNRRVSIRHCFERMTGNDAFGVSKLIEAAAYMLALRPDPDLQGYVDQRIDAMVASITPRLGNPDLVVRIPGHFHEAAVAYARATGKRTMLNAAIADARAIDAQFGPGRRTYISEHEGQKIGLMALARETGDERYWDLARFFLDERGKPDYPRRGVYADDRTYAQDQARVIDQRGAVGHAVRATFLYIALTDLAAHTRDDRYVHAANAIWEDVVFRKMYLSGGIGSIRFHERFGAPYELPNLSAWGETCAAYGNAVWNYRMFLLHGDARYIDVMERVLYNAFAGGVSLTGDRFFYQNPLKSFGDYERFEWINVPCCPPNVVRLTASIGGYVYAHGPGAIYVNLFVGSRARVVLDGAAPVTLTQRTQYPWDGRVTIAVESGRAAKWALFVRMPGWARDVPVPGDLYRYADRSSERPRIAINGRTASVETVSGYARIERAWKPGDTVEIALPMPVRRVAANVAVRENRGTVALERGPLVYCAEWPDNGGHALNIVIPDDTSFTSEWRPGLLDGTQVIAGMVQAVARGADGVSTEARPHALVAVPYHRWSNRGTGEMAVWMPRAPADAWIAPVLPSPIADVHTSGVVAKRWTGYNDQNDDAGALYDGRDPLSSADESWRYLRLRPPTGVPAAVEYAFKSPSTIASAAVYWFDDRRFCRLPASWRILHRDGDRWQPVVNRDHYSIEKDAFNRVRFEPVTTDAVRLEIEPTTTRYKAGDIGPPDAMFIRDDIEWRECGLLEWRIA